MVRGLLCLLGVAMVTCNLVHELGTHEHQALVSLDAEPAQATSTQESIAADEISALADDVKKSLPVINVVADKDNTGSGRTWGQEAFQLVQHLESLHKKLMERNLALRRQLAAPDTGEGKKEPYGTVNGMIMDARSAPFKEVPNADACELKCSLDRKCKSFSYNKHKMECLISKVAMGYSPDSIFYAKAESVDGAQAYHMYPGLFEATQSQDPIQGVDRFACQVSCTKEGSRCGGYSYRQKTQLCSLTGEPIKYDKYWDYYEKPPREFKRGHPEDVNAEDKYDKLRRETNHFWKEFQYHKNANDKRKLIALKQKVDKVELRADAMESSLRAGSSSIVSLKARVQSLKRASATAVSASRDTQKELQKAMGVQGEHQIDLELVNEKVEKRQSEVLKEDPDFLEKGLVWDDDPKIKRYNEDAMEVKKEKAEVDAKVVLLKQDAQDSQKQVDETDKQQIEALTQAKKTEDSIKSARLEMKTLAAEAKDLQKVVDKEEELRSPPPTVMELPSVHSKQSWDSKADEAEAKAKIFFMTPAEKKIMEQKKRDGGSSSSKESVGDDELAG